MKCNLVVPAALALLLSACASYDSGYSSRDRYYSDGNASVRGYDRYHDDAYPYFGYGYGSDSGYFPYDGFGFQFGYGSYGYGPGYYGGYPYYYGGYPYGYYDPWWYYGYRQHRHRCENDGDNDADDHCGTRNAGRMAPNSEIREQRSMMGRTNHQANPWVQRGAERPPSRLPDTDRPIRPIQQARGFDSPNSREELHRRRDVESDRR